MAHHYAHVAFKKTIILLFSYMNFYMKKYCMLLIYHEHFYNYWNVHHLAKKKTWKTFTIFLHQKLFHPKFELDLSFGYPTQTKLLHNLFLSYPNCNGNKLYICIYLIRTMEAFNNLAEKKLWKISHVYFFAFALFFWWKFW